METFLDMKLKIAFAGKICSGKTTTCYKFADYLDCGGIESIQILAFSHGIKNLATQYFQHLWDPSRKNRNLLIQIGDAMRNIDPDVWCKHLVQQANTTPGSVTLVEDVRMPQEYEALREQGFVFVYLCCDESVRQERHQLKHGTDTSKFDKDKTEALDWDNFWSKKEHVMRLDTGKYESDNTVFKLILDFYLREKGHTHLEDRVLDKVLENWIEEFDSLVINKNINAGDKLDNGGLLKT